MSIEGQGHFFTIYFPGFVCFVLYKAKISGKRLQDHWSSGLINVFRLQTSDLLITMEVSDFALFLKIVDTSDWLLLITIEAHDWY